MSFHGVLQREHLVHRDLELAVADPFEDLVGTVQQLRAVPRVVKQLRPEKQTYSSYLFILHTGWGCGVWGNFCYVSESISISDEQHRENCLLWAGVRDVFLYRCRDRIAKTPSQNQISQPC